VKRLTALVLAGMMAVGVVVAVGVSGTASVVTPQGQAPYSVRNFAAYPWLRFLSCSEAVAWAQQKGAYPAAAEHGVGYCEDHTRQVAAGPHPQVGGYVACREALAEYYTTGSYPVRAEHGLWWCQAYLGPANEALFANLP